MQQFRACMERLNGLNRVAKFACGCMKGFNYTREVKLHWEAQGHQFMVYLSEGKKNRFVYWSCMIRNVVYKFYYMRLKILVNEMTENPTSTKLKKH